MKQIEQLIYILGEFCKQIVIYSLLAWIGKKRKKKGD